MTSASKIQVGSSYRLIIFYADTYHHLIDIEGYVITEFDSGGAGAIKRYKFSPDGTKLIAQDYFLYDFLIMNILDVDQVNRSVVN